MVRLLCEPARKVITVDQHRRAIEGLEAAEYERLGYHGRWIAALVDLLLEKDVLTTEELGRRLEEVRSREGAAP